MGSWGMVLVEILFFAVVISFLLRKEKTQYKVSKDIWGLYESPEKKEPLKDQPMVIVFSSHTTSVKVESTSNPFNPENRRLKKQKRFKGAA